VTENDRSNFLPTASVENLKLRSRVLQQIRRFFLDRKFIEVDTPILSRDTVVDCYIDPIPVKIDSAPNCPTRFWLQTSPEFAMKRLLAAGMESIFQITRAFRNGEQGQHHNPEFTIVEWYQVGQSYVDGRRMLGELCTSILDTEPANEISYTEAFRVFAGVDPLLASIDDLRQAAVALSLPLPSSMIQDDRDEWLNLLMACRVEQNLGTDVPTVLFDYPASQSALARVDADNPQVAQRFELYVKGVELANGYHELCDADELQRRNAVNNKKRVIDKRITLPTESFLVSAMQHGLPQCTGVALGFDRLVMLAAGEDSIDKVMPFPVDRA
jgi:lysyl-tRNA synthetase class 2